MATPSKTTTPPAPKTLEEHRQYLQDFTRLQLWFVDHWARKQSAEDVPTILQKRVDLQRKTLFHAGHVDGRMAPDLATNPEWQRLTRELTDLQAATRPEPEGVFEEKAWQLLEPYVIPRAERDMTGPGGFGAFQCGSLGYDMAMRGEPLAVPFHIGNRVQPHSIFSDPAYLPACLRLLASAVKMQLGATHIRTGTWLNSYPLFVAQFPQEWRENLSEPVTLIQGNYGSWGQFISARGTLNHKHAAMFRKTGELPFPGRTSTCSIQALERHLDQLDAQRLAGRSS